MIRDVFLSLENKCHKIEEYFPLYDRYLSQFIGKAPKILEIGVQYGGSAELWYKYFGPGTFVHGVDINPLCVNKDYFKVYVGNQGDNRGWDSFLEKDFDIIIDDGSHENSHQILTLQKTYSRLKDGGIYWIEDCHTSYYSGVRVQNGGYKNPKSFIEYTKNLIDVINSPHTHHAIGIGPTPLGPHVESQFLNLYDHIRGVHFHDSVVVIEKGVRAGCQEVMVNY